MRGQPNRRSRVAVMPLSPVTASKSGCGVGDGVGVGDEDGDGHGDGHGDGTQKENIQSRPVPSRPVQSGPAQSQHQSNPIQDSFQCRGSVGMVASPWEPYNRALYPSTPSTSNPTNGQAIDPVAYDWIGTLGRCWTTKEILGPFSYPHTVVVYN